MSRLLDVPANKAWDTIQCDQRVLITSRAIEISSAIDSRSTGLDLTMYNLSKFNICTYVTGNPCRDRVWCCVGCVAIVTSPCPR